MSETTDTQSIPVMDRPRVPLSPDMKARFRKEAETKIDQITEWARKEIAMWERAISFIEADAPELGALHIGHPPYTTDTPSGRTP